MEPGDIASWSEVANRLYYIRLVDFITPYRPDRYYNNHVQHCPHCGSDDTCNLAGDYLHSNKPMCRYCGAVWENSEAVCLVCQRSLEYIDIFLLQCTWCGQVWEEDIIKAAYETNDENYMYEYNVSKDQYRNKEGGND